MSDLVQVYLWDGVKGDLESYGYVALDLGGGTYLSWWPKETAKKLKAMEGEAVKSLKADIGREGGKAPRTLTLLDLDVAKMRTWWKRFLASSKAEMRKAISNNCSTVAFHCLCEGNSFFTSYSRAVWTPSKLEEVIKKFQEKQQGGPKTGKVKLAGV